MPYLNAMINRTELLEENSFSDRMNACYPSWAAFVYTTGGKKYNVQNNYKDDQRYIFRFGSIMMGFPFLLDLKEGEFGDELEIIKEFRRNEDERGWKEWKAKTLKEDQFLGFISRSSIN